MAEHKILQQKVYHDGTSMIVLQPGDRYEVPVHLVADWTAEKTIGANSVDEDDDVREPQVGDIVTSEAGSGGWYTVRASWIDEPIKLRGEDKAAAEVARLEALIPTGEAPAA